jgi:hypothetical protein
MPDEQIEQHLCLDRGYAYAECQQIAEEHGYITHIPDKDKPVPAPEDPERHPPRRWRAAPFWGVVEVADSWFNRFRRLLIRWEKLADNYLGFVELAACLIIWRKLESLSR